MKSWLKNMVAGVIESLPSRERGLKYRPELHTVAVLAVAPFAGAWIEILQISVLQGRPQVAPFAGRELKYRLVETCHQTVTSLPSRNDGDSRTTILPPNLAPVPIPHNLSPIPTKTFAHVMTHVL